MHSNLEKRVLMKPVENLHACIEKFGGLLSNHLVTGGPIIDLSLVDGGINFNIELTAYEDTLNALENSEQL